MDTSIVVNYSFFAVQKRNYYFLPPQWDPTSRQYILKLVRKTQTEIQDHYYITMSNSCEERIDFLALLSNINR